VDRALRDVLGWTPKAGDAKGFVTALTRAFTPVDVPGIPGMRTWDWTPRGYALQADLGAITGAQASLYRRAQQALEESLPLIEGLTPLIEYGDPEQQDASRHIVRSELQQVVDELGAEGGPSVSLADELLKDLVGAAPAANSKPMSSEDVGGQLALLRDRFGLIRDLVNTVQEEQAFTNFLVLSDYVTGLWLEWGNVRDFFAGVGGGVPFFGTQLVLISRELEVAAESIREVYASLDAVLIGPAERKTLSLDVTLGTPPNTTTTKVFLGALLDWADRFITTDAPYLVETAGREGAIALEPTLETLAAEIAAFVPQNPLQSGLPPLYANAIVFSTFTALAESIQRTLDLITALGDAQPALGHPIKPPYIPAQAFIRNFFVDPQLSGTMNVSVTGVNLRGTLEAIRDGQRFALTALTQTPKRVAGVLDPALVPPGTWTLVLRQDNTDYVLGNANLP
jgi:hypothetical protein